MTQTGVADPGHGRHLGCEVLDCCNEHRPSGQIGFLEAIVRRGLIVLLAVAALAVPASASAKVTLLSVTSPASPGSHATLTAKVSQPTTCKIIVMYMSGSSHASGLYPKRS